MTIMKFGVGQPVRRVEDERLVRGAGRYTSDFAPKDSLYAHFIRSPHAHARFTVGDRERAATAAGVKAIYLASDFSALGDLPCQQTTLNSDGSLTPLKPYPVMAAGEVASRRRHRRHDCRRVRSWQPETAPKRWRSIGSRFPQSPTRERRFGQAQLRCSLARPAMWPSTLTSATKAGLTRSLPQPRVSFEIEIVNPRVVANFLEPRGAVGIVRRRERTANPLCGKPGRAWSA